MTDNLNNSIGKISRFACRVVKSPTLRAGRDVQILKASRRILQDVHAYVYSCVYPCLTARDASVTHPSLVSWFGALSYRCRQAILQVN